MTHDSTDEHDMGIFKKLKKGLGNTIGSIAETGSRVDFNLFSKSARIAVIGASRSGKTVLLTSLIDHLRNHDPRRFRLKPATFSGKETVQVSNYEELEVNPGMTAFPFSTFRQSLIHEACWPKKTKDTYQYRLKVYRDDSAVDRILKAKFSTNLSFLDFPGERIADAPITSLSFEDWSDYMLGNLPSGEGFNQAANSFLQQLQDRHSTGESLVTAYKEILAMRLKQFHTAISPSSFVLCPSGSTPERSMSHEELVVQRFVGVSRAAQFCPLDELTRSSRPGLLMEFKVRYAAYKEQLILPLYKALAASDHLCILVNIPEILQSGPAAYNDHVELLQQVVGFCSPKRNAYMDVLNRVTKFVGKVIIDDTYRPGGIEKAAFVATQADRIRPEDVNRLRKLVDDLRRNCTRALPHLGIPMESFTCVAVQATKPANGGQLHGRLMSTSAASSTGEPAVEAYEVSALPGEWPAGWNPNDYVFPDVWPKFNQNKNIPPQQIGLDRIFNYLIS
jgi:predicted YcjX-like family ATPase